LRLVGEENRKKVIDCCCQTKSRPKAALKFKPLIIEDQAAINLCRRKDNNIEF
jgi:hypothetical protein